MKSLNPGWMLLFTALLLLGPVAQGQRKPKIKGNRQVTEVSQNLPPFSSLRLSDDLEVHLKQGDTEGYDLEIDDNLVDVLRFEVADNTLTIASFYAITGSRKLAITVRYRELNAVHAEAGSLVSDELVKSDLLKVTATDAARLQLRLQASLLNLHMEGNSRADLNVEADSLHLEMGDQADASVYTANQGMDLELSGHASLVLEGVSASASVKLTDYGNLKAEGLVATRLRAQLEASAVGRLRADSELELDLSGGSRTYLYGQPNIRIIRFADRAELHKEPE